MYSVILGSVLWMFPVMKADMPGFVTRYI